MRRPAADIRSAILDLASERGPEKSFCPSEAARRIDPDNWRDYLEPVRKAAEDLEKDGRIHWLQRNRRVDPRTARGPVRLQRVPPE